MDAKEACFFRRNIMQDFRNPKLPLKERVRDLLSRLTVEEKIGPFDSRTDISDKPL